jgi:hypothetical protein
MLTPTDVHFLVGLLTLVSRPDGVDLELGSMVFDAIADEDRDVDITVRSLSENGTVSIFEGIEVKHHKRPLDVTHIEHLCTKLRDMPDILTPGIVSSSGYTEPATRKASHNGVTLYSLCDWTAPMKLGGVMLSDELKFHEQTYEWVTGPHIQFNPNHHLPDSIKKQIETDAPLFDRNGVPLSHTPTYRALADNLASQTTALSEQQGQPLEMKVGETRSVTFNINLDDEPYIIAGTTKITLSQAQLTGELACVEKVITPMFKVLVRHADQQPFVGCAVFEMSMGNLAGISVDSSQTVKFINVPIADRLLKKIYRRRFT